MEQTRAKVVFEVELRRNSDGDFTIDIPLCGECIGAVGPGPARITIEPIGGPEDQGAGKSH